MRSSFAIISVLLLAPATVSLRTQSQTESNTARPNVIYIMADDSGYSDYGAFGSPDIKTPNIDTLAREGIKLTDFYANGMLCSATRAGLISGRYQQRYGIEGALPSTDTSPGLIVEGRSLPQLMKNAGYATALLGKWHLGMVPEHRPRAHGFDYFFGFLGSHEDMYHHNRGEMQPDLWEDDASIYPALDGQYMTDLISEHGVQFIEQSAVARRPFFLEMAYNAPHWPYQPPNRPSPPPGTGAQQRPEQDNTATRADYAAMVEQIDIGVGQILRTLDRLGLAQNTLVIYTNDHGGEWLSDSTPLFHRKWTIWEGGIRVPLIVRWPGHIQPGRVSDQVGITMDLSASMLTAVGAPVPLQYEGINLLPILEGRAPEAERTLFWRMTPRQQKAVRQGDWKLMVDGDHEMLFDLRTDMAERHDLARVHPEIVRQLRPLIAKWEADVDAEVATNAAKGGPGTGRGGVGGPGGGRGAAPAGGGAPAPTGRAGAGAVSQVSPLSPTMTLDGFDPNDRFFDQFFVIDPVTGAVHPID